MAAAREKTLAHRRLRDQNLQQGWRFIQNGGYGKKSEKIWVQDVAKGKINKLAEKAEVQFKKKMGKNRQVLHVRVLGIWQSVRGLSFFFCFCLFLFCYFKVRSNGCEGTRLRNSVPLVDSMLLK